MYSGHLKTGSTQKIEYRIEPLEYHLTNRQFLGFDFDELGGIAGAPLDLIFEFSLFH